MLPGQYVYTPDRQLGQVTKITATHLTGPRGVTRPATSYDLIIDGHLMCTPPVASGDRPFWLTPTQHIAALHTVPRLLPPCRACGTSAGYPCTPDCPQGLRARIPAPDGGDGGDEPMSGHLWAPFQGRCTCGAPCERGDDFKAHLAALATPAPSAAGGGSE